MFVVNINVILFTLKNIPLIRWLLKMIQIERQRPNCTGRTSFFTGCVFLLLQKSTSVSLANSQPGILTLLVFMHATNGFTIANQPCTRAGDILDCVYCISGTSTHTCDDQFPLPEQLAAGQPPNLPLLETGQDLWWEKGNRLTSHSSFSASLVFAVRELLSLVGIHKVQLPQGLSALRMFQEIYTRLN